MTMTSRKVKLGSNSKNEVSPVHENLEPVLRYIEAMAKDLQVEFRAIKFAPGSPGYLMGYRYGSCRADEVNDYVAGGCVLV